MEKEKYLFFRTLSLVSFIFVLNFAVVFYLYGGMNNGLTGNSVTEVISNTYTKMPSGSKVFLVIQWTILLIVLLYFAFRDGALKKRDRTELKLNINNSLRGNKTDLDILYDVLKEKKELRISDISKAFKIEKDIALEWSKILESGELATLDYPGFGEPILRIKEVKYEETPVLCPANKEEINKIKEAINSDKIKKTEDIPSKKHSKIIKSSTKIKKSKKTSFKTNKKKR